MRICNFLRKPAIFLLMIFIKSNSYAIDESFFNPTGNPVGGGGGYNFIVDINNTNVVAVVGTRAELWSALNTAKSGDIVYVHPDSTIDLSGFYSIFTIKEGVILASNRGQNGALGGRILKRRLATDPTNMHDLCFATSGPGARITGLRLAGPDSTITQVPLMKMALKSTYINTEIDNCEFSGWSYYAIWLQGTGGYSHVHHCHISHCRRGGYGYGIVAWGRCLVEACYFHDNRHDITADVDTSRYMRQGTI